MSLHPCRKLAEALDRAARSEIAAFALMVDAKDKAAVAFYRHHGFMALPDSPRVLFLPLATVQQILGERDSCKPGTALAMKGHGGRLRDAARLSNHVLAFSSSFVAQRIQCSGRLQNP